MTLKNLLLFGPPALFLTIFAFEIATLPEKPTPVYPIRIILGEPKPHEKPKRHVVKPTTKKKSPVRNSHRERIVRERKTRTYERHSIKPLNQVQPPAIEEPKKEKPVEINSWLDGAVGERAANAHQ